ncbi:MAG: hypothetical protein AAF415_09905 [Pseudomonadota bacterium]
MSDLGENRKTHPSWLAVAIGLVGAGLLLLNLWKHQYFYHDDAFISLRYALNFVNLGDLSWNPGDRVEGYTNFLHLLAVGWLIDAGIEPVSASRIVNAGGAVLLLLATGLGAASIAFGPYRRVAVATGIAGVAAAVTVALWVLGGLETILAAGLVGLGVAAALPALRSGSLLVPLVSGIPFALAYLTRPDAVIMTFAAGLGLLLLGRADVRRRLMQMICVGIVPVAVLAAHMIWRMDYYGDLLPNTFYAKVGIDIGIRLQGLVAYAFDATAKNMPVMTIGGLAACAVFIGRESRERAGREVIFLLLCIFAHVAYIAWTGGDHMPGSRVLAGILAPAGMLLAAGICSTGRAAPVAAVATTGMLAVPPFMIDPKPMDGAAYVGRIVGQHILRAWPEGSTVALNTAGSTPYFAPGHTYIDMLGLNDREIAKRPDKPLKTRRQSLTGHSSGDGTSVLRRKPDYIIIGPAEGRVAEDAWYLSGYEIARDPGFASCYTQVQIQIEYDVPAGEKIDYVDDPLTFTYYERHCPD